MTHAERILEFLRRREGLWFDDDELARHLGIPRRRTVNRVCNQLHRQGLIQREYIDGKLHNRWIPGLAETPAAAAVESETGPDDAPLPESEWWWEGNVQAALMRHLRQHGWSILSSTDTRSRERGTDVVAQRGGTHLAVEVKGYPSTRYVRGPKRGQPKPTRPRLQARHWLAEAVLATLVSGGSGPGLSLRAIALPSMERYRSLLQRMDWALTALGIGVFFVHQDGHVEVWREPRPFRPG